MYQRPTQQRRQLNQVSSNSAFVNHQMPPPPPPPQQFTQRRVSTGTMNGQQPPTLIHRPPPTSPGNFGAPGANTSSPNLYGTNPHTQTTQSAYPQPTPATYPQHNPQNHYGEVRRKPVNSKGGGGVSCGFFLLWTFLLAGGGWIYFNYFLLPGLIKDVRKEEVEHTKHHWMTKYHTLQLTHEALEKSHVELKETAAAAVAAAERAQKQAGLSDSEQVESLNRELEETRNMLYQERTWAGEWKQKALGLEDHANFIKRQIQDFSKRKLIQK